MSTLISPKNPLSTLLKENITKQRNDPEMQDLIDSHTKAQLTKPHKEFLNIQLESRSDYQQRSENQMTVRQRLLENYQHTQFSPPCTVNRAIWEYITSEYPSESMEEKRKAAKVLLGKDWEAKQLNMDSLPKGTFKSGSIDHVEPTREFEYVKSGKEATKLLQRRKPRSNISPMDNQIASAIAQSKNIPNAVNAIQQYSELREESSNKLFLVADHTINLHIQLLIPAVWDNDVFIPFPHPYLQKDTSMITFITRDEEDKDRLQNDILLNYSENYRYLTRQEFVRTFENPKKSKSLLHSNDVILVEKKAWIALKEHKIFRSTIATSFDIENGAEDVQNVIKSAILRIMFGADKLIIRVGRHSDSVEEITANIKHVLLELPKYVPWEMKNISNIQIVCGNETVAPPLTIYRSTHQFDNVCKRFSKSKSQEFDIREYNQKMSTRLATNVEEKQKQLEQELKQQKQTLDDALELINNAADERTIEEQKKKIALMFKQKNSSKQVAKTTTSEDKQVVDPLKLQAQKQLKKVKSSKKRKPTDQLKGKKKKKTKTAQ